MIKRFTKLIVPSPNPKLLSRSFNLTHLKSQKGISNSQKKIDKEKEIQAIIEAEK